MTDTLPDMGRRKVLTLLGSLMLAGRAGGAWASTVEAPMDTATMLVAGPDGGSMDRWGRVVQPALAQGLPPAAILRLTSVGATDGVTGANQFLARGEPDGRTVLLVPGDAAVSWLVGDPRAQYDVGQWVPIMAAVAPATLIARTGTLAPNRPVRLAATGPASTDLPAILGIDLLGARTVLVPPRSPEAQIASFARGEVDAVFLRGHRVVERATSLLQAGGVPMFSLGARDEIGKSIRCQFLPDVPTLAEAHAATRGPVAGPLYDAWLAAAVASQLEFMLVLPHLTSAAAVALWRRAGAEAMASLDVQSVALPLGVRVISGAEASATGAAIASGQAARNDLRRWLEARFNWRPA
jgi:hypothetical protein